MIPPIYLTLTPLGKRLSYPIPIDFILKLLHTTSILFLNLEGGQTLKL